MLPSHRATKIDPDIRIGKLKVFIMPVQIAWQNPEMDKAISSFGGFCELLGLNQVREYLVSRRVHEIQEWGFYQLDAEGQAVQKQLEERLKVFSIQTFHIFWLTKFRLYPFELRSHSLDAQ